MIVMRRPTVQKRKLRILSGEDEKNYKIGNGERVEQEARKAEREETRERKVRRHGRGREERRQERVYI